MKEYTTEFLRNIALVSHGGAGKTMLAEAFLHATGATTRLGKVEDGTTVSDYDEEENRRNISRSSPNVSACSAIARTAIVSNSAGRNARWRARWPNGLPR